MKGKFLTYAILLTVTSLVYNSATASNKKGTREETECESYVSIQGSSNINRFQFINYNPEVNNRIAKTPGKKTYQNIQIPVNDFAGPNSRMLDDFYKMIKAAKYPHINISLEPRQLADFDETTGMTNFKTKISIAGNSGEYVVPCKVEFCEGRVPVLKGELKVELTDFKIDPPTKIFGAVKVDNEVFINFAFRLPPEETLTENVTF